MPFLGPHYRFAPLEDEFFVELAPGEEVDHTFDLSIGYRLEAGNYEVIAEYLNPAGGSHEGTRAIVFEPGDGPMSPAISLEISP